MSQNRHSGNGLCVRTGLVQIGIQGGNQGRHSGKGLAKGTGTPIGLDPGAGLGAGSGVEFANGILEDVPGIKKLGPKSGNLYRFFILFPACYY